MPVVPAFSPHRLRVHTPSCDKQPIDGAAPRIDRRRRLRLEALDPSPPRGAAQLTFDTVRLAAGVATIQDLDDHFGVALRQFGFDVHFGIRLDSRPSRLDCDIVCGRRHRAWENHYVARNYLTIDPVVAEMLRSSEPAFWSELAQRRSLRAEERSVLSEAARFGMTDGFFFALHHPKGPVTGVVLAGSRIDAGDCDTRTAARLLAGAYDGAVRRILLESKASLRLAAPLLKARQAECLRWVAAGKSSAEIAIVLQLSRKTIDEHIDNACRIFGVNTRIQAVIRALELQIIQAYP